VIECRDAPWGLRAEVLASAARVLGGGYLAVNPILFPAGLVAMGVLGAVHAVRAPLHIPARVEAQIMPYCRQIQPFKCQFLDELQPFQIIVGVETSAAPPPRTDDAVSLPDPDGLGMDV